MPKKTRDDIEGKVETELEELQEVLDELEVKAEADDDVPDEEGRRILAEQRLRLGEARNKFLELQDSSDAAWDDLRSELDEFILSLRASVKDAGRAIGIEMAEEKEE